MVFIYHLCLFKQDGEIAQKTQGGLDLAQIQNIKLNFPFPGHSVLLPEALDAAFKLQTVGLEFLNTIL